MHLEISKISKLVLSPLFEQASYNNQKELSYVPICHVCGWYEYFGVPRNLRLLAEVRKNLDRFLLQKLEKNNSAAVCERTAAADWETSGSTGAPTAGPPIPKIFTMGILV